MKSNNTSTLNQKQMLSTQVLVQQLMLKTEICKTLQIKTYNKPCRDAWLFFYHDLQSA